MRIYHGFPLNEQRLERELDERWRSWLWLCLAVAATVGVSLATFVGPHQTVTRIRYEIAQLSEEVDRLDRECRRLSLERESLTSPHVLAQDAVALGLELVPQERVAYLTPGGHLVATAALTPPADQPEGAP